MKAKWHIGCSGFHYDHWKNIFYPESVKKKEWFEFYATQFNTLELNVTFYRFPTVQMFRSWHERSPDNFSFSVKVPRLITHFNKLNNSAGLTQSFYDLVASGLGKKAGCILFQMPPSFHYTSDNFERVLAIADRSFKNVFEFRHSSWWNEDVKNTFQKAKLGFCGISHPDLPDGITVTDKWTYFRFHGLKRLYSTLYSEKQLDDFIKSIRKKDIEEIFIYFNNDVKGYAIMNATYMRDKTGGYWD
jgi:uncharacterized protein YecE (DUF72 family)